MFLSTKFIIEGIDKFLKTHNNHSEVEILHKVRGWFFNFENSQIDKPTIVVNINERAVVLYANDALWEIVQKWQNKQLDNLTMLDGIKIWKEIKNIMEKDKI